MPKILVADDNSNIQKMVGLALKDQGIDVVAVGNGEAAVRKISDVRPDLVLADVFMPVRNGYEVCKFVKGDSSLAHIPVILLVGAFDPLDEEEAQRVGADGVLKKPFVPPDPLISMVKSALVRASTGAGTNPLKPAPANNASPTATVPSLSSVPAVAGVPNEAAGADSFVEEIPPKPPELKIETGGQPLAFGSLMETPTTEKTEEDSAFYSGPTSPLPERDWNSGPEEEDEEEEDSGGWRPDAAGEEIEGDAKAAEKRAKAKREPWTPTREKKQDLLEDTDAPQFVSEIPAPQAGKTSGAWGSSSPAPVTPPAQAEAKKPPVEASKPVVVEASKPVVEASKPVVVEPGKPAKPIGEASKPVVEASKPAAPPKKTAATEVAPPKGPASVVLPMSAPPMSAPPMTQAPVAEAKPKQPEKPAAAGKPVSAEKPAADKSGASGGSWFSISSTPWEAEAKQTSQAPAWDAPPAPPSPISTQPIELTSPVVSETKPSAGPSAAPGIPELEPEPSATGFYTDSSTLPELVGGGEAISPEAVEALRQEATQVIEESTLQQAREIAAKEPQKAPEAAPAADMDALVAKVLAKLNPDVLQAVTREILKPVIEAVVREEMKPKK